jgi:hypothetical protein
VHGISPKEEQIFLLIPKIGGVNVMTRVARFFLVKHTKTGKYIYTKFPHTLPNGHKIYLIAVKYIIWLYNKQNLPLQDPPKFTQIGKFGSKITPSGNPVRT